MFIVSYLYFNTVPDWHVFWLFTFFCPYLPNLPKIFFIISPTSYFPKSPILFISTIARISLPSLYHFKDCWQTLCNNSKVHALYVLPENGVKHLKIWLPWKKTQSLYIFIVKNQNTMDFLINMVLLLPLFILSSIFKFFSTASWNSISSQNRT